MQKRKWNAGTLARIGVLAAMSAVLYLGPEIPVIPPIYKLDFSAVPALLAAFSMGPAAGLLAQLIKDLTGLLHTSSMGVGELADFLMSGTYIVVAALIWRRGHGARAAAAGMAAGTACMALAGAAANYWIMIPFYMNAFHMPVDAIVGMVAKTLPAVDSLGKMILLAVVPFNLLKGAVISAISGVLFKYLRPLLSGRTAARGR